MFTTAASEICVLGAIFMDESYLTRIQNDIVPTDFSAFKNRLIFKAMMDVVNMGKPVMPTTVLDAIPDKYRDDVTSEYIAEILSSVITSAGIDYHVKAIKTNRVKSQLLSISSRIIDNTQTIHPLRVLQDTKDHLAKIKTDGGAQVIQNVGDVLPMVYDNLVRKETHAIPTGFADMDKLLIGWHPGDLVIIAGRPGMGKSILAKEFAEAAKIPVLFFSLEMPTPQLIKRQLSSHSGVNYATLRRGTSLTDVELGQVKRAMDKVMDFKIAYSDKANMSMNEIAATCEAYRKDHELGMVVIDYLQLIRADGQLEYREREVAQISQRLKTLARDLNIPVICLAQLNRSCETRGGDKKPQLSDLRESGSIEQDADVVIFIWREWMYAPKTSGRSDNRNEALLIIAKARNAETGSIRVHFDGAHQRIRDLYIGNGEDTRCAL